jgi:hypothetical protein
MLQNIRWRTVLPFISMTVRLSQYGQDRFKPKRKGKRVMIELQQFVLTALNAYGTRA